MLFTYALTYARNFWLCALETFSTYALYVCPCTYALYVCPLRMSGASTIHVYLCRASPKLPVCSPYAARMLRACRTYALLVGLSIQVVGLSIKVVGLSIKVVGRSIKVVGLSIKVVGLSIKLLGLAYKLLGLA